MCNEDYEVTNRFQPPLPFVFPELYNSQGGIDPQVRAGAPEEDGEVARLDDILEADVPEAQVGDLEIQVHRLGLPGSDWHLGEPLELQVGHHDAADEVLDVQLHDLGAVARRVVGHVHRDRDGVGAGRRGLGELQVCVHEGTVGQAVGELKHKNDVG
jgi:hypothetical protein